MITFKTMLEKMFLTKHSAFRLAHQQLARHNPNFNPFENIKDFDAVIKVACKIRDTAIKNPKVRALKRDVVNSYE